MAGNRGVSRRLREGCHFAMQPGFCEIPIANNGEWGNLQYRSRFFDAESAKEAKFDESSFSWIELRQARQCFIECKQIGTALRRRHKRFVQGNGPHSASALLIPFGARVIDQHTPHDLRSNTIKVSAIFPARILPIRQTQVRFINQGSRLEGVLPIFATHASSCEAAEFVVDQRAKFFRSRGITFAPGLQ